MSYYEQKEISDLGEHLARCHFKAIGKILYPIDPEIIATRYFGLDILPKPQLMSVGVKSGIDTTQSIIFIDQAIYMNDSLRYLSNQSVAHELAHAIFDVAIIRGLSGSTIEDVFERHSNLMQANRGIESRANMLSGAFLVPRSRLIQQISLRICDNYEKVVSLNPTMTMSEVLSSMTGSQLCRFFGQSGQVLGWRIEQEDIYSALETRPEMFIKDINIGYLAKLSGTVFKTAPLSERIKSLLPKELLEMPGLEFA